MLARTFIIELVKSIREIQHSIFYAFDLRFVLFKKAMEKSELGSGFVSFSSANASKFMSHDPPLSLKMCCVCYPSPVNVDGSSSTYSIVYVLKEKGP